MAYVDGFVMPIPKRNVSAYRRIAQKAGRVWQEHGALEYRECVGDDLDVKMGRTFPRQLALKRGETVVFSWILYRSRSHRDQVNAKVMKDPRLRSMMDPKAMPFDMNRMVYGGFEAIVDIARARASARRPRRPARGATRERRARVAEPQPTAH